MTTELGLRPWGHLESLRGRGEAKELGDPELDSEWRKEKVPVDRVSLLSQPVLQVHSETPGGKAWQHMAEEQAEGVDPLFRSQKAIGLGDS